MRFNYTKLHPFILLLFNRTLSGSPASDQTRLTVGDVDRISVYLNYFNNNTDDAHNTYLTFTIPRIFQQPQILPRSVSKIYNSVLSFSLSLSLSLSSYSLFVMILLQTIPLMETMIVLTSNLH